MDRRRNKRTVASKHKTTKKVKRKQITQIPLSKPPNLRQTKLSFACAANDSRTNAQGGAEGRGARMELHPTPKRSSLTSVIVSPPSNHNRFQYSPDPFPNLSIAQPQAPSNPKPCFLALMSSPSQVSGSRSRGDR